MNLLKIFEQSSVGKKFWLFIHPYVYISVKKKHAILYNALNGFFLEYRDDPCMLDLLKRLNSDKSLYVIGVKPDALTPKLLDFVGKLRNSFSGDIMEARDEDKKPINFKPIPSIQKSLEDLTTTEKKSKQLAKDNIQEYLNILSLFLTSKCNQNCKLCSHAFKQCMHCYSKKGTVSELPLKSIEKLLNDTRSSNLSKLNILGGNIFNYSRLIELVRMLNDNNLKKEYFVHIKHLADHCSELELLSGGNCRVNVLIHFSEWFQGTTETIQKLQKIGLEINLHFLVEEEANLEEIEIFLNKVPELSEHIHLVPFYNGKNIDFFKEVVFLTQESIAGAQPSMKEIFSRQTINSMCFKHLFVRWDGAVFSNMNHKKIGDIHSNSIYMIMDKELNKGHSWTKLRKNVTPCKSCPFHALCPPIDNYEYVLKRYNLCHIM